jgi:hypothetical protein
MMYPTARDRAIAKFLGKKVPKNKKTLTPEQAAEYLACIESVINSEGKWYHNYLNLKRTYDDLEAARSELQKEINKLKLELLESKGK